eukprot:CAMPEP_0171962526 /NCGR_PEP_ID=MMETSP0993-20121228/169816_1 /TAXON_ID=483369 /ORGANISM="non described non described, Strain CCMP2098" /LENGTH=42 /DNA_ID= /DNA_START= /DNA_END= /DNA_ORIENTATION=
MFEKIVKNVFCILQALARKGLCEEMISHGGTGDIFAHVLQDV